MKTNRTVAFCALFTVVFLLLAGCATGTSEGGGAEPTALPYSGSADTELSISLQEMGEGDPAQGKVVFDLYCSGCHSVEEAVQIVGPSLFAAGEKLQFQYIVNSIDQPHDVQSIETYELDMPEDLVETLSPNELNDVVAYVQSLKSE